MTTSDFFRLIIKGFGTYCFINALFTLIPNMSYSGDFFSMSIAFNSVYILLMVLIAYFLLFQTDSIIKLLRLNKGYDNSIIETKNLNPVDLFKFTVILMGFMLITNNLAQFLNYAYLALKNEVSANGLGEIEGAMLDQHIDYNWWIISGLNVVMGFIILINYKPIAQLFTGKKENLDKQDE